MAPIHRKRSLVPSETSIPEPSTWKVLVAVGSAGYLTYHIWSQAQRVWHWLQRKIYLHNREKAIADSASQQKKRSIKVFRQESMELTVVGETSSC